MHKLAVCYMKKIGPSQLPAFFNGLFFSLLITALVIAMKPLLVGANTHPEISLSSSGVGVGISLPMKHRNSLRITYEFIDAGGYKLITHTSDVLTAGSTTPVVKASLVFDDTFHPQNFGVLIDHHLNNGPLYVSAGLDIDANRIQAISRPSESNFLISGQNYSGSTFGPITITVRWNPIVPYVGLGFQKQSPDGTRHKSNPRFEIGVLAQGPRRISVGTSGIVALNPAIFDPYVKAFTAQIPSHVPTLAFYPIVRISLPIGR